MILYMIVRDSIINYTK